jgi:hypothetical protein
MIRYSGAIVLSPAIDSSIGISRKSVLGLRAKPL